MPPTILPPYPILKKSVTSTFRWCIGGNSKKGFKHKVKNITHHMITHMLHCVWQVSGRYYYMYRYVVVRPTTS